MVADADSVDCVRCNNCKISNVHCIAEAPEIHQISSPLAPIRGANKVLFRLRLCALLKVANAVFLEPENWWNGRMSLDILEKLNNFETF